jgi:hypothetical protein
MGGSDNASSCSVHPAYPLSTLHCVPRGSSARLEACAVRFEPICAPSTNTVFFAKVFILFALATPRHRTVRDPESVNRAVVRRRWPRWWDLPGDGRQHSQICHERTDILFVPVRCVVPDHALPMESATVRSDAASDGSGDLFVGPRADPCSHIAGNVATSTMCQRDAN